MLNTQSGTKGGYLVDGPAKPKRLAIMRISHELWYSQILVSGQGYFDNPGFLAFVRGKFLLPDNCEVVAVSLRLDNDVVLKLSCQDFREVPEGRVIPQIEACYACTEDLLGKKICHFAGWVNERDTYPALVPEYRKPDPPRTDRCSEELGHFTDGMAATCYCERLILANGKWVERVTQGVWNVPVNWLGAEVSVKSLPANADAVPSYLKGLSQPGMENKCPRCEGTGEYDEPCAYMGKAKCVLCGGAGTMEAAINYHPDSMHLPKPTWTHHDAEGRNESEPAEEPNRSNRGYEFL